MILLFATPTPASITDQIQSRLLRLAALFLLLTGAILTLAPAVRLHSWIAPYRWQHWAGFVVWLVAFALIHRESRRWLPDRDGFLIPVAALLTGWGLMTIWRLSPEFGLRQTIWLAVCSAVFLIGMRIPGLLTFSSAISTSGSSPAWLITALTFVFGTYPGGTGPRLWLGCCGFYLQPSEPLKLLLIIYLAAYLADSILINFSLVRFAGPHPGPAGDGARRTGRPARPGHRDPGFIPVCRHPVPGNRLEAGSNRERPAHRRRVLSPGTWDLTSCACG